VQRARKYDFHGIILLMKNPWTTPSVHHGPAPWPTSGAHRSSSFGHSEAQGRWGRGGGGAGGGGEHICGLIGAREGAKRRHDREGWPAAVGAQ
jgi:hypothetical protein